MGATADGKGDNGQSGTGGMTQSFHVTFLRCCGAG